MANCKNCGKVDVVLTDGTYKCKIGRMNHAHKKKAFYREHFLEIRVCEKCEVQNENFGFFDVNHKDGDHDNNRRENLELLCPNCHRIETLKQWKTKKMTKYNRIFKYAN